MSVRRTPSGWRASNGRTYKSRKAAVRSGRQARVSSSATSTRKRRDRKRMRGKRR